MKTLLEHSLTLENSFAIEANAPKIFYPTTTTELTQLSESLTKPYYILGEGSNTLFCQSSSPTIIKPSFTGVSVEESESDYLVTAACGENWHQLVQFCIEKGIYGLENLALIPGSVGAAPVQNIGAYGVEISRFIDSVSWFDFKAKTTKVFTKQACQFDYRQSIFKESLNGLGLITKIRLRLSKVWQPVLSYQGLNELPSNASAADIMAKVIAIRSDKLPDPKVLPNAGSFFKNPIINQALFTTLQVTHENMPHYIQENGDVKIAAGWLIEQSGLKGLRQGSVGVHKNQALVLVNYEQGSGEDLINLAKHVQQTVFNKFAITLVPEVRFVGAQGEMSLNTMGHLT
jgi:UDP-N-acetylmuramate dehydrogenase